MAIKRMSYRDIKAIKSISKSNDIPTDVVEKIIESYKIFISSELRIGAGALATSTNHVTLHPKLDFINATETSKIHLWGPAGCHKTTLALAIAKHLEDQGFCPIVYVSPDQPLAKESTIQLTEFPEDAIILNGADMATVLDLGQDAEVLIIDDISTYSDIPAITRLLTMPCLIIMLDQVRAIFGANDGSAWFRKRPANSKIYENVNSSFQLMVRDEHTVALRNMKEPMMADGEQREHIITMDEFYKGNNRE